MVSGRCLGGDVCVRRDVYRVEIIVMAKRGAGGQQHLEDAKEGLLEREGAGISVTCKA